MRRANIDVVWKSSPQSMRCYAVREALFIFSKKNSGHAKPNFRGPLPRVIANHAQAVVNHLAFWSSFTHPDHHRHFVRSSTCLIALRSLEHSARVLMPRTKSRHTSEFFKNGYSTFSDLSKSSLAFEQ